MALHHRLTSKAAVLPLLLVCAAAQQISINGTAFGHVFDGVGGLSAGASSRLLWDYPPQQQNDILDMLFRPQWGLSLQIIKVEEGGDDQSTGAKRVARWQSLFCVPSGRPASSFTGGHYMAMSSYCCFRRKPHAANLATGMYRMLPVQNFFRRRDRAIPFPVPWGPELHARLRALSSARGEEAQSRHRHLRLVLGRARVD
jgi:hypothetical protein